MWNICAGGLPDYAPKDSGQVIQAGAPAFGGECRISKFEGVWNNSLLQHSDFELRYLLSENLYLAN